MNRRALQARLITAALLLVAVAALAWWQHAPSLQEGHGEAIAQISLPTGLSDAASKGREVFAANCASCHGVSGEGSNGLGPPLVHIIYEPSHHGDASFHLAVANGVRAHHWPFGNMAPVEGVTPAEVDLIIAYVRELQQHNGIR